MNTDNKQAETTLDELQYQALMESATRGYDPTLILQQVPAARGRVMRRHYSDAAIRDLDQRHEAAHRADYSTAQ